ncbi:MAG TPA: hypothetical protein VGA13_09825 [Acidimicrobiales bacterium]|jgi:hypothetical protein
MATLTFDGESHQEIVLKVRRWLASVEGAPGGHLTPVEAVEQAAEITKDALRVLATAAPGPVAQNDIIKGLTSMGYRATDISKEAVVAGLDSVEQLTGGSVLTKVRDARKQVRYEMSGAVARQILNVLKS